MKILKNLKIVTKKNSRDKSISLTDSSIDILHTDINLDDPNKLHNSSILIPKQQEAIRNSRRTRVNKIRKGKKFTSETSQRTLEEFRKSIIMKTSYLESLTDRTPRVPRSMILTKETVDPSQMNIIDNYNGTYDISYVPVKQGQFHLCVTLNGDNIKGSPFLVNIEQDPYEEIKMLMNEIKVQTEYSEELHNKIETLKEQHAKDMSELSEKLVEILHENEELKNQQIEKKENTAVTINEPNTSVENEETNDIENDKIKE